MSVPSSQQASLSAVPLTEVTIRQLKAFNVAINTAANAVLSDGTKYYGDIRPHDGAPHGRGYAYLADGSRYGGDWRDGKFHGKGAIITDSYEYEGSWEYGRMHGTGTMLYKDSIFSSVMHGIASITPFEAKHRPLEYRGDFHHVHHRHGKGIMVYRSGDCYEGEWSANQRDGYGTMKFENGEKYVGCWAKDERSGVGTMTYNDGSLFTGTMINDQRNGEGVLKFPNGDEYNGSFQHDIMEGHGVMKYRNGDVYTGMWKDGIRHGKGEFLLHRSNATITGNFVKGLIQGKGCVCILPGRSVFKGEYYKGERIGGTCWMNDGGCYHGEWVGDSMAGKGLMWYPNGDFYYGQFARSKRHGKGCLNIAADGTEYAGEFIDDKWCGVGMRQDRDGNISAGAFGAPEAAILDVNNIVRVNKKAVANNGNSVKILPVTKGIPKAPLPPSSAGAPPTPTTPSNAANGATPTTSNAATPTAGAGDRAGASNGTDPSTSAGSPTLVTPAEAAEVFPLLNGYQGEWDGEQFCGIGNLYLPNGDHFFGLFEQGYRHGVGTMSRVIDTKDKTLAIANMRVPIQTTGRWVRDSLNGYATVRFGKGTLYQGQWVDGMREGHGQFRCEDGTVYNGSWKEDVQFGEGCLFVVNRKEPVYAYPPEPKMKEQPATGLLSTMFSVFSSAPKEVRPEPILLGYEDLCAVHGNWVLDTDNKKDMGKLYGTVSIFFSDVYEKVYQGQWVGNRQRIDFPHRAGRFPPFNAKGEKNIKHDWDVADEPLAAPEEAPEDVIVMVGNDPAGSLSAATPISPPPSLMNTSASRNPLVASPDNGLVVTPTSAGTASGGAATTGTGICTFCHSQFGFFKKELSCAGCQRISCPSCLTDSQPPFLSRTKYLSHTSGKFAVVGTVPLCADCITCMRQGTVFATQWFTFRRRPHDAAAASRSGGINNASTASAPQQFLRDAPTFGGSIHLDSTTAGSTSTAGEHHQPTTVLASSNSAIPMTPSDDVSPARVIDFQVYRGYFIEGNKPHVHGTLWRSEDCCYRGDFRDGRRCGQGSVVFTNGEEYFGSWLNDMPHGVGVYRCNDGTAIEAFWECGKVSKLRYQGEIAPTGYERHGTGVAIYEDGTRYNGEWEFNSRHGTGLVQYSNGTIYSGQFVHDNQHGLGKIVTADSVFMGHFDDGAKHGAGVLVVGRKTLQGTWSEDVLSGWVRIWNDDSSEIIETLYMNDEERCDVFIKNEPQQDEAVSQCPGCKSAFGFFLRRHHCRLCGGVFCDSCSKARWVVPSYFGCGDVPQRVCNRCKTTLNAGCTLAIKRYRDGGVYVGQWSQGRWASRGMYRTPDGIVVNVLSKPPGGLGGQTFVTSGPGLHEDLNLVEEKRHELGLLPPATQTEIDGFAVWWDKIVNGVGAAKPYDFTAYSDIPAPVISLPFEVKVFSEYTPGSRARDRQAVEDRRRRFVPATVPPMPRVPWHLKPVRPRKVVEPTEEQVLASIRTERVTRYLRNVRGDVEGPATVAEEGVATIHGGASDRDLSDPTDVCVSPLRVSTIKTIGDLRRVGSAPSFEAASVGGGRVASYHGPHLDSQTELMDPGAALPTAEVVAREQGVLNSIPRVRINLATPPVPKQEDDEVPDWTVWEPKAIPQYKGIASAPGGEALAPRGDINIFHVEGLDSGPLPFDDMPQKFKVIWKARGQPEVIQTERHSDDLGPEPLPAIHVDPTVGAVAVQPVSTAVAAKATDADRSAIEADVGPDPAPSRFLFATDVPPREQGLEFGDEEETANVTTSHASRTSAAGKEADRSSSKPSHAASTGPSASDSRAPHPLLNHPPAEERIGHQEEPEPMLDPLTANVNDVSVEECGGEGMMADDDHVVAMGEAGAAEEEEELCVPFADSSAATPTSSSGPQSMVLPNAIVGDSDMPYAAGGARSAHESADASGVRDVGEPADGNVTEQPKAVGGVDAEPVDAADDKAVGADQQDLASETAEDGTTADTSLPADATTEVPEDATSEVPADPITTTSRGSEDNCDASQTSVPHVEVTDDTAEPAVATSEVEEAPANSSETNAAELSKAQADNEGGTLPAEEVPSADTGEEEEVPQPSDSTEEATGARCIANVTHDADTYAEEAIAAQPSVAEEDHPTSVGVVGAPADTAEETTHDADTVALVADSDACVAPVETDAEDTAALSVAALNDTSDTTLVEDTADGADGTNAHVSEPTDAHHHADVSAHEDMDEPSTHEPVAADAVAEGDLTDSESPKEPAADGEPSTVEEKEDESLL